MSHWGALQPCRKHTPVPQPTPERRLADCGEYFLTTSKIGRVVSPDPLLQAPPDGWMGLCCAEQMRMANPGSMI